MFKWLLLFLCPYVVAHEHHTSFSVHGLVLMQVEHKVIASHLPTPAGLHARQLIFEVQVSQDEHKNLIKLIKSEPLVTFAPNPFELDKLRTGDIAELTGNLYRGHFEREGTQVKEGLKFKVNKVILDKPIVLADNGYFYMRPVTSKSCLLVHKIGRLPSFDQIVQVSCRSQSNLSATVDSGQNIPWHEATSLQFRFIRSLYLETQDFSGG
ncbi:hypothetical protein [Pseudoalteromonas rubra]|uniref:hypothetical protein n=1 Tax=Pseudoalteromonas rubra TaxID=43658 RepID=UPI000F785E5C|nr:hypothetical protein [Pseudoalteromonas rubra]